MDADYNVDSGRLDNRQEVATEEVNMLKNKENHDQVTCVDSQKESRYMKIIKELIEEHMDQVIRLLDPWFIQLIFCSLPMVTVIKNLHLNFAYLKNFHSRETCSFLRY